jgi:hypothetical protein
MILSFVLEYFAKGISSYPSLSRQLPRLFHSSLGSKVAWRIFFFNTCTCCIFLSSSQVFCCQFTFRFENFYTLLIVLPGHEILVRILAFAIVRLEPHHSIKLANFPQMHLPPQEQGLFFSICFFLLYKPDSMQWLPEVGICSPNISNHIRFWPFVILTRRIRMSSLAGPHRHRQSSGSGTFVDSFNNRIQIGT